MEKLNREFYCLSCEHILEEQGYNFLEEPPIQGLPKTYTNLFCKNCGQKIEPNLEQIKGDYATFVTALSNPKIKVVAFVAPSVRAGIGELFGLQQDCQWKIVTALKKLGVHEVFSMNFGADLTICEESKEFAERLKSNKLPMFTSCCPAWVNYATMVYPQILPFVSTCKSPQQMFGAVINNIYTKINNINPTDIFIVSIVPCIAKKVERIRKNINSGIGQDVDACVTTKELAELIKQKEIDFAKLEDSQFDPLFREYSGYGSSFGISGGVADAVIKNLYPSAEIKQNATNGIIEKQICVDGKPLIYAQIQGVVNTKKVIEDTIAGKCKYALIEVMACSGGCVGGPGQPSTNNIEQRTKILKNSQKIAKIVNSKDNATLKKLYAEYIDNKYAEKLLHEKR